MSFWTDLPKALGKITEDGVFLEQLETNPIKYLPEVEEDQLGGDVVKVSRKRLLQFQAGSMVWLGLKEQRMGQYQTYILCIVLIYYTFQILHSHGNIKQVYILYFNNIICLYNRQQKIEFSICLILLCLFLMCYQSSPRGFAF